MLTSRIIAPAVLSTILISTLSYPAHSAGYQVTHNEIKKTWTTTKKLGNPTSNHKCGIKNNGCFQKFQKGSIHWSSKTGAHPTFHGNIQKKWGSLKYENGYLGYPTGKPLTFKYNKAADYQNFQGGMIITNSQAGTHTLKGAIRNKWKALGWERSTLKLPTSDERGLRNGAFQKFQGGSIHWSPKTGAHPTKGAIQKAWGSQKYERGRLGYPTSDEYKSGGKTWQDFEGGKISWTSKEGARIQYAGAVPESFAITGSGFGHGVGMSQYGAQGMALEGKSAEQILEYYYNPAQLESVSTYANSDIKVQILGGVTSTTITPSQGSVRIKAGKSVYQTTRPVTVQQSGSTRVYKYDGKTVTSTSNYDTIEWQNTRYWSGNGLTTVAVSGADAGSRTVSYRHGKILVSSLNNKLNLVNELRLHDEYLYGLAEMPSSWEPAALSSQAIAGRTYAMRNMSKVKTDCACHVYDEVKSQKFSGWNKENEGVNGQWGKRWKSAVDNTVSRNAQGIVQNAQVMRHKGSYIDAVYSSSSNGKTQDSRDMWGGSVDYLKSRNDPWSVQPHNPNRSWTVTKTQAQVASAFKLKNVSQVSVQRNAAGYVSRITAVSQDGQTSSMTGNQLRAAFGLKSSGVSSFQ